MEKKTECSDPVLGKRREVERGREADMYRLLVHMCFTGTAQELSGGKDSCGVVSIN